MNENNKTVDVGQAIGYGWSTVKKDLWYFVLLALIDIIIGSIGSTPKGWGGWDVLNFLVMAWITGGLMVILLSYHRGKKLHVSELFLHTERYWRILGATLLISLIVGLGFVLLIVPGIYFALKYLFTIPLIVDKNMSISDAMRESDRLSQGRKMTFFQFGLLSIGIICLGAIAFGVGILVAIPVVWLGYTSIYQKLTA